MSIQSPREVSSSGAINPQSISDSTLPSRYSTLMGYDTGAPLYFPGPTIPSTINVPMIVLPAYGGNSYNVLSNYQPRVQTGYTTLDGAYCDQCTKTTRPL